MVSFEPKDGTSTFWMNNTFECRRFFHGGSPVYCTGTGELTLTLLSFSFVK